MNKKIQEQLDKQISRNRAVQIVEVSEAPTLTSEIFDIDDQESAVVEVNFRDMSARRVETSDAPKLTKEILQTKGKPVKTVEVFLNGKMFQVSVRDGISLSVEIDRLKLILEYSEGKKGLSRAEEEEMNRAVMNLMISKMMVDPQFSYQGEGEGIPIEERSSVIVSGLSDAVAEANYPEADDIYQIQVRYGIPADAFALFGKGFSFLPVGKPGKKFVDMSSEELLAEETHQVAERQVLIPKMILDPVLSYGEVERDTIDLMNIDAVDLSDIEGYPVELLSERYQKTLYAAHKVINVPSAGMASLQRFL